MLSLGIDTSNYSTSLAVFDSEAGSVVSRYKKILDVDAGKNGLRQSDAVFCTLKTSQRQSRRFRVRLTLAR